MQVESCKIDQTVVNKINLSWKRGRYVSGYERVRPNWDTKKLGGSTRPEKVRMVSKT